MTTTTVPRIASTTGASHRRRVIAAGALSVSGIAIVLGHAFTVDPNLPAASYLARLQDQHTSGTIGGLLTAMGALLLLPGLTAALGLVTARGATLATIGAAVWGAGAAALAAGDVMITLVMSALVPGHLSTARSIMHVAETGILGLPFAFAPLFVLGAILFAVSLLVSRAVPGWLAAMLLVGAALVFVSSGGGWGAALTLTPLGLALVLLGVRAGSDL